MLASVASLASTSPALSGPVAPLWGSLMAVQAPWRVLQLAPPCLRPKSPIALPCADFVPNPDVDVDEELPEPGSYAEPDVALPSVQSAGTLGGFVNYDVTESPGLTTGPEVSWLTPESPREDLLRLRVVAPGWGVSYSLDEVNLSLGIAVCTRFVMLGEDMPVVDVLTSEARIELRLP